MDASIATLPPRCRARNMTTPEPYVALRNAPDAYCVLSAKSIRGCQPLVDPLAFTRVIACGKGKIMKKPLHKQTKNLFMQCKAQLKIQVRFSQTVHCGWSIP